MDRHIFPKALSALVHHIQLTQSGWRERALEYVIQLSLYQHGGQCPKEALLQLINQNMPIPIGRAQIEGLIANMVENEKTIFELPSGNLKLASTIEKNIHDEQQRSSVSEKKIEVLYKKHFSTFQMEPRIEWNEIDKELIIPLICELGAKTYEILSGDQTSISDLLSVNEFLKRVPDPYKEDFCDRISKFVGLNEPEIKEYLLRLLNASFLVHATALSKTTIDEIYRRAQTQFRISIIVDTNFLFSLIGLHENPADDVVEALKTIMIKLKENIDIGLFILPVTVEEAKRTLANYSFELSEIYLPSRLVSVALEKFKGFSGITAKYFKQAAKSPTPINAEAYFKPYIDDLARIAKTTGIAIANDASDKLSMDFDVLQDLALQQEFEKAQGYLRPKPYEAWLHDVILWHYVDRKRPKVVESPLDALYWVVTIDHSLLNFDRHKQRTLYRRIPTCIHPTVLLQILQFWVPRTEQLEKALISSLLPLLPHSFDNEAEAVSMKILKTISRYENVSDLTSETVTNLLVGDAVRSRISNVSDKKIQNEIVRDAIVDDNKRLERRNKMLLEEKREAMGRADRKDKVIEALEKRLDSQDKSFKETINREREKRVSLEEKIRDIEESNKREKDERHDIAVLVKFLFIAVFTSALLIAGLLIFKNTALDGLSNHYRIINPIYYVFTFLIGMLWIEFLGKKNKVNKASRLIGFISKIRKIIWAALGTLFLSVLGAFIYDSLKNS